MQNISPYSLDAWQSEHCAILLSVCGSIVDVFIDIGTFKASQEGSDNKVGKIKYLCMQRRWCHLGYCTQNLSIQPMKEGDGLHILRWHRFMLLIFKATSRKNYSTEAFILLTYLLSPREKFQLLYSRFINRYGPPGRNISCDSDIHGALRWLNTALRCYMYSCS